MRGQRTLTNGLAVGAIGALSIAVASVGVATAANGDSLLVGHHNSATKTTTLTDKTGTPLALLGKKSKPPLTVNSSKLVKHLNAAQVGGLTAAQLKGHGSAETFGISPNAAFGSSPASIVVPMAEGSPSSPTLHTVNVVGTSTLPAGSYIATASGFGDYVGCWIDSVLNLSKTEGLFGIGPFSSNPESGSGTAGIVLTKPGVISMYCYGISFSNDGTIGSASITAVPVGSIAPGSHAATTP